MDIDICSLGYQGKNISIDCLRVVHGVLWRGSRTEKIQDHGSRK